MFDAQMATSSLCLHTKKKKKKKQMHANFYYFSIETWDGLVSACLRV